MKAKAGHGPSADGSPVRHPSPTVIEDEGSGEDDEEEEEEESDHEDDDDG